MSEWEEYKLGEKVKLLSGGTPSKQKSEYWNGHVLWVSTKDLKSNRIYDTQLHLTDSGASNGTKHIPAGTILLSVRGMRLANELPISMVMRGATFNQDLKAILPLKGVDNLFLFYWFLGNAYEIRSLADEAAHGTKRIQTDRLLNFDLLLPPLETQRKIASVLSAYDDLIENNNRRIQVLEEAAQALYREWFVEFRFPGHEDAPLVESELGMIPQGWEVGKVADFGEILTGKTPSKKQPENFGNYIQFIKTPDMHNNMFILQTNEMLSQVGCESQKNNTIPPNSICISCIGTVGLVSITTVHSQTNQQINSIVLANNSLREFAYFALLSIAELMRNFASTGATMANLSKGKFIEIPILFPSDELIARFHKLTRDMFDQTINLQRESQLLREARDGLLPRLVSGEVDVSELDVS